MSLFVSLEIFVTKGLHPTHPPYIDGGEFCGQGHKTLLKKSTVTQLVTV